jgi:hypothetical protein
MFALSRFNPLFTKMGQSREGSFVDKLVVAKLSTVKKVQTTVNGPMQE